MEVLRLGVKLELWHNHRNTGSKLLDEARDRTHIPHRHYIGFLTHWATMGASWVISFVVAWYININILTYNNIVQINTNLIPVAYKTLFFCSSITSFLLCALIIIKFTFLYIVLSSAHTYNYCFMQLSFNSYWRKKRVASLRYLYIVFYIYLCSYFYCCFWCFHLYLSSRLVSFNFSLKGSL